MRDTQLPMKVRERGILEQFLALATGVLLIELVFFKFIPDIGTAFYQNGTSALADFEAFKASYMTPGSVHSARFLGNRLLLELAGIIASITTPSDIRLHPLRIAAGILTPLFFVVGALPGLSPTTRVNWRSFLTYYTLMFCAGLYVFYPCDAPAIAFTSLGLACLLRGKMLYALASMFVIGLFRESAFHMIAFVTIWSAVDTRHGKGIRLLWTVLFTSGFFLEYQGVRIFYPAPITSMGGLLSVREMFEGSGLLSLTSVVTLSLALVFPASYFIVGTDEEERWVRMFMRANCALVPIWLVFYRAMGGGLAEFRMLWPVLLPCVYGIGLRTFTPNSRQSPQRAAPKPAS
jgi:hypothetical protein